MKQVNLQIYMQTLCCDPVAEPGENLEENNPQCDVALEKNNVIQFKRAVVRDPQFENEPIPGKNKRGLLARMLHTFGQMLKSGLWGSRPANRFFGLEEQRKFELEVELKKHYPHYLNKNSFFPRGDL